MRGRRSLRRAHGLLVVSRGLPLDERDGACRARGEAVPQPVAEVVAQRRLAADEADGPFVAGRDAQAAAGAGFLVDLDDGSYHERFLPGSQVACKTPRARVSRRRRASTARGPQTASKRSPLVLLRGYHPASPSSVAFPTNGKISRRAPHRRARVARLVSRSPTDFKADAADWGFRAWPERDGRRASCAWSVADRVRARGPRAMACFAQGGGHRRRPHLAELGSPRLNCDDLEPAALSPS